MRLTFLMLPLAVLAACGTPREQCIGSAGRELRTLDRLIRVTEGNINRGYAIAEVTDVRTIRTRCEGTNEDGSTFRFPCEETETIEREEPVAIDVREERSKLQSLRERRAAEQRQFEATVQQCRAVHPE